MFISTILPLHECILKLNRPTIEIKTQERAKNPEMSSLKFCLWGGGTETTSENCGSEALIN